MRREVCVRAVARKGGGGMSGVDYLDGCWRLSLSSWGVGGLEVAV